ncbi:MAG: hypothetical protein RSB98_02905 [Raoultibacter sp.]
MKNNDLGELAEKTLNAQSELEPAKNGFSKDQILTSKRYRNRRDALSFLLGDKEYTHDQVQTILDNYMKGTVK